MQEIRQFINFIPLKGNTQSCIVATTRQYSKELAQRQAFLDLQGKVDNALFEKICTKELAVDEDGMIRFINEEGDILSEDTVKL